MKELKEKFSILRYRLAGDEILDADKFIKDTIQLWDWIIENFEPKQISVEPVVILQEAENKRMNVAGQKKQIKFMGQMLDMGWDKEQIPLLVAIWKNLRDESGNLLASQSK